MKLTTKSNLMTAVIFAMFAVFLLVACYWPVLIPITAIVFIGGIWFKRLSAVILESLIKKEEARGGLN